MKPSSTSSSSRPTWAGLLALAIVLAIDRIVFGLLDPWDALSREAAAGKTLDHRVLHSHAALRTLKERAPGTKALLVVGSSRAGAGYSAETFRRELPDVMAQRFSFPGLRLFELRSLVEDFVEAEPDAVILAVSEFDTHRTIRLSLVPGSSAASTGATLELARLTGARFAWEQRHLLARYVLSDWLETYRFRGVLGAAGLDDLRTFPRGRAHPGPNRPKRDSSFGPPRRRLPTTLTDPLMREFPGRWLGARHQIQMLREIQHGIHVSVQQALLERSVEIFAAAGIHVVLVETPLHPGAVRLIPETLRSEFRTQAGRLRDRYGATWLPLPASTPYTAEEFSDLLHLTDRGSERFTSAIARALRDVDF